MICAANLEDVDKRALRESDGILNFVIAQMVGREDIIQLRKYRMEIPIILRGIRDKLIALGNIVLSIFVLQIPFDLSHHHLEECARRLGLATRIESHLA